MSIASQTIRLFRGSPPAPSSSNNAGPFQSSPAPHDSPANSTQSISAAPTPLVGNKATAPDDMKFEMVCSFFGSKLKVKEFEHDFRGMPWCFEFYKKGNSIGLKIQCMAGNKSRLWKCSASICRQILSPTPYKPTDKFENYEFEAGKDTIHIPNIDDRTCLIEYKFIVIIKKVIGIPLQVALDFTKPKENVFDACLVIEGKKVYVNKSYLAMHSPYFNTLFFSHFAERQLDEIPITDDDIKYDDFIDLLYQLYPNRQMMCAHMVEIMLKYADRFDVSSLTETCQMTLLFDQCMDKAHKLHLAEKYRLAKLQNAIIQKLKTQKDVQKLSKSRAYGELSDASKTAILNRLLKIMDSKEKDSDFDADDDDDCPHRDCVSPSALARRIETDSDDSDSVQNPMNQHIFFSSDSDDSPSEVEGEQGRRQDPFREIRDIIHAQNNASSDDEDDEDLRPPEPVDASMESHDSDESDNVIVVD